VFERGFTETVEEKKNTNKEKTVKNKRQKKENQKRAK
jgi:hypothetical protein